MAVKSGSGKGGPLGEPRRHGSFPHRLCRLAERAGASAESAEAPCGVRALLRDPCCKPPGYPGSRSPQDILSVPSRDRLDLKSEHHPNPPSPGASCTHIPHVSSSLRPVSRVPSSTQPCSPRQALWFGPATCQWPSPVSLFPSRGLKHCHIPAPACPCPWPCRACNHLAASSRRSVFGACGCLVLVLEATAQPPGQPRLTLGLASGRWNSRKGCALVFADPNPVCPSKPCSFLSA